MNLGISGLLTRAFIASPLTPLMLLAAIVLGVLALMALPREEEPQISVPVVDIMIDANGLKAADAVELVTEPLEDIVKGINEVEHVYSVSEDDRVIVTARFDVGTAEEVAVVRVHDEIRANLHRIPIGIPEPMIVGRGINDVPIVTLTLAPKPDNADRWNDNALYDIAEELIYELVKVPDVGLTFIVGGRADQIRVEPDPERLALNGVTLAQLVDKVRNANRSFGFGNLRQAGKTLPAVAGQTLKGVPDIGLLLITARDGRPVYVRDVADVIVGAKPEEHRVWHLRTGADGTLDRLPAVTLAIAKRQGANAVDVSAQILDRLEAVRGRLLPAGVEVSVTRDYGATAEEKADELLFHLGLATVSIVVLITVMLGWREGLVVMVVVPTTILLTLFAAWMMGYTINRVSLFALIFSIGILVDDAIVVVENIVRHWKMGGVKNPVQATIAAVAEVGNPTIVATLTIVAALLPMMFVSGLMGPYMSPIPANASAAMLFSFFIAVIVTPWFMCTVACRGKDLPDEGGEEGGHGHDEGAMGRFYRRMAAPLLVGRARAGLFLGLVALITMASLALFATRDVTVKLLPFDNKSEFQIVVDLPEGASLEDTERVLIAAAERIRDIPELTHLQAYAGTAAPFNFNGLVRHYYLRGKPWEGDLQVNLTAKHERDRQSHDVALEVRAPRRPRRARRHQRQGGRGAAWPAGAEHPDGRGLRARRGEPAPGRARDPQGLRGGRLRRRRRRFLRHAAGTPAIRDRSGEPRIPRCSGAGGLRHPAGADRRRRGRLFAPRRRGQSGRDLGAPAEVGSQRQRTAAVDADPGAGRGRRQRPRGRNGRRAAPAPRTRLLSAVPPQRPFRRPGHRRAGRPLRGPGLRHAGGRGGTGEGRLERHHRLSRPADRRVRHHIAVGRRVGDHIRHLPRHGARLRLRSAGDLRAAARRRAGAFACGLVAAHWNGSKTCHTDPNERPDRGS